MSGFEITYEDLSFLHGSFEASGFVKFSYQIGSSSFIDVVTSSNLGASNTNSLNSTFNNFTDFTTDQDVTWRISLFGNSSENTGTRMDDITIRGTVTAVPEPTITSFLAFGSIVLLIHRRK